MTKMSCILILKSYKIWTMTKMSLTTEMSHILIKDQKVTKSEQWPKCHIFWSKVKKLQIWTMIRMTQILIKGQKVTKSEQLPKCRKVWSKIKKLQNLNNYQNVANSDQRSKSYKIWTMTKTLFPLDFVISYTITLIKSILAYFE